MQRFLGAVNFNREFSVKVAEICAPLDKLRTVRGPIKWTPELIECFDKIKLIFADSILLRHVDWGRDFTLTTDSSLIAAGAWLGQPNENGDLQVIACVSKKYNDTQMRWSATKRELYAAMWAMRKFRKYLLGRKFTLSVDHQPLVSMLQNPPNHLLEGWIDEIMTYNFVTNYIPGHTNVLSDAISRQYESSAQKPIRVATRVDKKINIRAVSLDSRDINSHLLFEAARRGKTCPPLELQTKLISDEHSIGHFGVESMYRNIWDKGYWWPNIRKDLEYIVKSCSNCQRYDIKRDGYHPSKSVIADNPWDHLQIDLIGPVPTSKDGYSYILTIADVFTGYTVIRALKNKGMEFVARKIWKVLCEYGLPKIMQSDNGTEFVNALLDSLLEIAGVEHRLITAYHPQANGLVERKNKDISRLLKKLNMSSYIDWDQYLPIVQYALNTSVNRRTGSTPFALMFNRRANDFDDYRLVYVTPEIDDRLLHITDKQREFLDVVIPAIRDRTFEYKVDMRNTMDTTRKQVSHLKPGQIVYAKDGIRNSKWDLYYEGPFEVVNMNDGGAYTLKDMTGALLTRRYTIDQLKPAEIAPAASIDKVDQVKNSIDNNVNDDVINVESEADNIDDDINTDNAPGQSDVYEIESIIDHKSIKKGKGKYQYLVKWNNWDPKYNSWVNETDFHDYQIIRDYWDNVRPKRVTKSQLKNKKK
jgi:hypothetical protein